MIIVIKTDLIVGSNSRSPIRQLPKFNYEDFFFFFCRLKAVVKASKIKIVQQAAIISEQSILLREAKCPPPFYLSDSDLYSFRDTHGVSESQFPDSEQTFLPAQEPAHTRAEDDEVPAASRNLKPSPHDNFNSKTSSRHAIHQHFIYTHAHNNLAGITRTDYSKEAETSSRTNRTLSLKSNDENARVRYRERGPKTSLQSGLAPVSGAVWTTKNGNGSDSESVNESDGGSREGSPSFLTDLSNKTVGAHSGSELIAGSKENPLEVDEPMSCSMFGTCTQTSSAVAKLVPATTPTKRKNVEKIVEQLSSRKKAKVHNAEKSFVAGEVLPMTPGLIAMDEANVDIVPVTPGVKTVDSIVGGGRRDTAKILRNEKGSQEAAGSEGNTAAIGNEKIAVGSAKESEAVRLRKSKRITMQRQPLYLEGNELVYYIYS